MNATSTWIWMATAMLMMAAGCQRGGGETLRTITVRLGTRDFVLEVADTDATRQRGLMYRAELPPDHGMLFVFSDEQERMFWMKDVPFPLDIVFLGSDAQVVSIRQMKPFDRSTTYSHAPAKYAIELNKDAAEAVGLKVGTRIPLPPDVAASR